MKTIRMLTVMVAIAFTCACLSTASAQDGNWYLEACRNVANGKVSDELLFKQADCSGSIAALRWVASGFKLEGVRSCAPKGVTREQIAKVVVAYLDKNPARLHEPFAGLALMALAQAWPCPPSR